MTAALDDNKLSRSLAHSALELARVFESEGRLVVTAPGRQDHARHVAVEFIHPAITGARSLPAVAVEASQLRLQATPQDAVLVISSLGAGDSVHEVPQVRLNLQTGEHGSDLVRWYHVLWELVQLSLEHPGLTGGSASKGGDTTSFLYPFLDAAEEDEDALLDAMISSAQAKRHESFELAAATVEVNADTLAACAREIAEQLSAGGQVFTIGNGGSACDAARLVRKLTDIGVRASCLAADPATLTALANDIGVAEIFTRQVEAVVKPTDVLLGLSTSGSSPNLISAFNHSAAKHAVVISCSGYGGGPMSELANVDHRLVVESSSVHRIQEAQTVLIDKLCEAVANHMKAIS